MRTIKFRGKTVESAGLRQAGDWAYGGYFVDDCYSGCPEGKHHIVEWNSTGLGYFAHTKVIKESVGQYTGLKDKNGKEIYEGDIITYEIDNGVGIESYCALVFWSENVDKSKNRFEWLIKYTDSDGFDALSRPVAYNEELRVIGNIFENKELLECEK